MFTEKCFVKMLRQAIASTGDERRRLLQQAADIRDAVESAIVSGDAKPLSKSDAFGMMGD